MPMGIALLNLQARSPGLSESVGVPQSHTATACAARAARTSSGQTVSKTVSATPTPTFKAQVPRQRNPAPLTQAGTDLGSGTRTMQLRVTENLLYPEFTLFCSACHLIITTTK